MYFSHAQFFAGVGDPCFSIGSFSTNDIFIYMSKIIILSHRSLTGSHDDLQGFDIQGIGSKLFSHIGAADYSNGRSIADTAAIKQTQRPGDDGGIHNLFNS